MRPNIDLRCLSDKPVNKRVLTEQDRDPFYPWDIQAFLLLFVFLVGVGVGMVLR